MALSETSETGGGDMEDIEDMAKDVQAGFPNRELRSTVSYKSRKNISTKRTPVVKFSDDPVSSYGFSGTNIPGSQTIYLKTFGCSHNQVLKPAVHQVAGHGSTDGRQGPVVDDSGRHFFKPLHEGDARADREIAFYGKIKLDESIPPHIKDFFPAFYGTKFLSSVDGQEFVRHGVMENLTYGFKNPSITDIKIGYRTWYPEASEDYIKKTKKKDKETTSGALGIRVSGLQVYEASTGTTWKPDRISVKVMSVEMVRPTLVRFVSSNPSSESFDGAFAASVYGGPQGVLAKLEQLKEWFSTQTSYHFASSSVLIIYESSTTTGRDGDDVSVDVKLVDFAHTVDSNSVDENFLRGLKSLISFLSSILEEYAS